MAFTKFVPDPNGSQSAARTAWGSMPLRYLKVGYTGTTVEDSGWINTSDVEILQLTVRGADANNAMQLYGAGSTFDGQQPNASEVLFPIGAAITADANEYVQPVPEWVKLNRTTTNGGSVTATINGFLKARKTGAR